MKKNKIIISNIIFVAVCLGIFFFLWNAPPETTAHLPKDSDHERFMTMDKKEAEKYCGECHDENGIAPLPEKHPTKLRCLLCHKRN